MLTRPRSGTTLLEVVVALTIVGMLAMLASASYANARSVLAVRGCRDAIVAAAARARMAAIGHGGASLIIDQNTATLRVTTRDGTIDEAAEMRTLLGVEVLFDGAARTSATIQYDGLGIGRLANRTISISRERARGGVTFSAYGRPRQW